MRARSWLYAESGSGSLDRRLGAPKLWVYRNGHLNRPPLEQSAEAAWGDGQPL